MLLQNSNGITPNGGLNVGVVRKICNFRPISYFASEMMQDRAAVTVDR